MSRRRTLLVVAVLLASGAWLTGCGGGDGSTAAAPVPRGVNPGGPDVSAVPPAVLQAKDAQTPVAAALVSADNTFGLNLLNTLIPTNAGANTAIAPISVAMALQIAYNGAAGTTQQAMAGTLQLNGLSVQQLNDANAALLASLIDPDPKVTVTVANSLWLLLSHNKVSDSFTSADQTYYGAEVGDLAGAPANVNAWVATQTNGLITQILPDGNYTDGQTAAVLTNVVYFKGQWASAFDPQQTTAAPFTLADGTRTTAQMMQQTATYPYLQGANFQALSLPYGQGRLSMLVVLPGAGVDLAGFVAGMTPEDINNWVSQMGTTSVAVALPRFTASFGRPLPPALTTLGMGVAFDGNLADFSGICARAYLSDVEHKTVVEVDENGTIATGATTVTIGIEALPVANVKVVLDRPFFYAIRDNVTGELLFVGVLMNPG
jgi:serine protease inhibitor